MDKRTKTYRNGNESKVTKSNQRQKAVESHYHSPLKMTWYIKGKQEEKGVDRDQVSFALNADWDLKSTQTSIIYEPIAKDVEKLSVPSSKYLSPRLYMSEIRL